MRIHLLSDLHIEFGAFDPPEVDADLLVLAGDVHIKRNGLRWIRDRIPDRPVIYILGNHEFYGEKFPRLIEKLKQEAADSEIHVLENDYIEMGGFRFIGCTLWTDMALHGDPQIGSIEALQMTDYKRVRHSPSYKRLRPIHTRFQHHLSVRAIKDFLETGDSRRSIVVTHHAPSIRSLPKRRWDKLISCAYASNLENLIEEHRPLLWIHGHIHHSQDYLIGDTRVVSNPRAYIDELNPRFDPNLVIDLRAPHT